MDPILLRPNEAGEVLGVSRARIYELLREGTLPSIKVGGRLRVPVEELREWVREQSRQTRVEA